MKRKNNTAVAYSEEIEADGEVEVRKTKKAKKPKLTVVSTPEKTAKSDESEGSILPEDEVENLILDHRENGRKLARSILRRWRVRMPADEIDSIVDLALCEAARRFSPDRGASFMTFYFYHLRGHLVRAVTRAAQASSMFLNFGQTGGTDTLEWKNTGRDANWNYIPENYLLGQRDAETPEHHMLRKEKISECQKAITKLDDLEREIIVRCYGSEQPLVEIARTLGYSRCHVSRVKKSALDRLKTLMDESVVPNDSVQSVPEVAIEKRPAAERKRARRRRSRQSRFSVKSTQRIAVNG